MASERVLVTGAAGFIGSHLCRRLVADGAEVVGFDDLSGGSVDNLADIPEVDLTIADIRDEDTIAKATTGCSVVFHQAAIRSVPRSMLEPGMTTDVNVRGTLNVLLAARDAGAVFVAASSSSVYGDQTEFPLREDLPPRPRSPYAASKLAGEIYGAALWRSYGVPAIALRYFNAYGPGQDPESEYAAVVPRFVTACMTGERPIIHGDGEQARDFTYIDDVVEANIRAAHAPEEAYGLPFNVGGGAEPTSVNGILDLIAENLGVSANPIHEPPRVGDIRLSEADIGRATRLLGFHPSVDINTGITRTVRWFKAASRDRVS